MKIGLLRERKNPPDNRVPLTPIQANAFAEKFPEVELVAEASDTRCFTNEEYETQGIKVQTNMDDCDVLLGVKEVPIEALIEGKTYMFFSHTIKAQPYNKELLKAILKKRITLIDYEVIKWENGQRVLGFGRWAGIVGAYNGLLTYGQKTGSFHLKPAYQCRDFTEMLVNASQVKLDPIKIAITGNGRVATGSLEVLRNLRIREVSPTQYLRDEFDEPVFVHLHSQHLYRHPELDKWDSEYFYAHNSEYMSTFGPYTAVTNVLIHGIFWGNDMPIMFSKQDAAKLEFKIGVIADITCDVDGSIPITYKYTNITNPIISWDKSTQSPCNEANENSIEIMAVGNLPNELPRDASETFGEKMLKYTLPEFLKGDSPIIENAIMTKDGKLRPNFAYLQAWLDS